MTKKERQYLENLEECFEQVKSAYTDAKVEISELTAYIEVLEELCRQHSIENPDFQEPSFF
jgi:hypothetical protein